jgi:hypothetical protein
VGLINVYPDFTLMLTRYSLLLTDTVKVGKDSAVVLTDGCSKLKDVVMDMEVGISDPQDLAF